MKADTLLLRQINPGFVQAGRVTSQAFRPSKKDNKKLSVYDGNLISAPDSYRHWTEMLSLSSCGTLGVSCGECTAESLTCVPDPKHFEEHALIEFTSLESKSEIEDKAKILRDIALARGWLYVPISN